MATLQDMRKKLETLAKQDTRNMLNIAKAVNMAVDLGLRKTEIAEILGFSLRKVVYMKVCAQLIKDKHVSVAEWHALGWTKVAVLSTYLAPEDIGSWVDFAGSHTVNQLTYELQGKPLSDKAVVFRLTASQHRQLNTVLERMGARVSSRSTGLSREAALMKLLRVV